MSHILFNIPHSSLKIPKVFNSICLKDKRLDSIMIEINKRVYLDKNEDYYKLKDCIEKYYEILEKQ